MAIIDLLYELREELAFKDRRVAEEIAGILFERGGVIGSFVDDRLVGLCGYFLGDPGDDFIEKDVAFIYVAGIAEPYRCTRLFLNAYRFIFAHLRKFNVREIRLQAGVDNAYTNRLYARLFTEVGRTANRRGLPVIQYRHSFEEAAQRFTVA